MGVQEHSECPWYTLRSRKPVRSPTCWCSLLLTYTSQAKCLRLRAGMRQERGTASYRPVLREGGIGAPGGLKETECRTSAGGDTQARGDGRKPQKKATAVLLRGDGLCRWGARRDRR